MAYYNSSYSGSDYGEYNFNSYSVNYDCDYDQVPSLMTYNSYDYNQPNHGYDSSSYFSYPSYSDHSYNNNHQTISYSTTSFSDPKYIVYDPNYGMTQLVLSYSTLEFNEPAFDEYDPTPYGGGYDIVETYGKPQPPSDKICYPKVVQAPNQPPIPTPIPVLASNPTPIPVPAPIPVPVLVPVPLEDAKIEEKVIKPQNETIDQIAVEKPKPQDSTIKETNEAYEGEEESEDSDYSEENDVEDEDDDDDDDDINSGSNYEKEVTPPQYYPSGYGLETLDICESLFGHWPCLAKMKRENCCNGSIHRENHCQENMWKGTADYLFGTPYPYGGRRDDDYYGGEFVYGYERH